MGNIHKIRKPISVETLKKEFSNAGCVLLSNEYGGYNTHLEYICQCGHKHSMPYYCFHSGQGRKCPKCIGNQRKTIDEVRKIFSDNGCILLSTEYKWNRQKLSYIAKCGHVHLIKASAFFEGEGRLCPKCQRIVTDTEKRKYDQEYYEKMFSDAGCKLLSNNITTNSRVKYIATCGHETDITIAYFTKGSGRVCRNCYKKTVSRGEKEIKEILNFYNIKYESQYRINTSGKRVQMLDFFLPQYNVAIEFNGRQHYEKNHFFHNDSRECMTFESQLERDARKRRWCIDNGIELIEIDARNWTEKTIFNGMLKNYIIGLFMNKGWIKNHV